MFVDDGTGLGFALHPVPTNHDVLAILDRIIRRVARRLANEAVDDLEEDAAPDVFAQVQAEAAATWRSPVDAKPTARGVEHLRGVVFASPPQARPIAAWTLASSALASTLAMPSSSCNRTSIARSLSVMTPSCSPPSSAAQNTASLRAWM